MEIEVKCIKYLLMFIPCLFKWVIDQDDCSLLNKYFHEY